MGDIEAENQIPRAERVKGDMRRRLLSLLPQNPVSSFRSLGSLAYSQADRVLRTDAFMMHSSAWIRTRELTNKIKTTFA